MSTSSRLNSPSVLARRNCSRLACNLTANVAFQARQASLPASTSSALRSEKIPRNRVAPAVARASGLRRRTAQSLHVPRRSRLADRTAADAKLRGQGWLRQGRTRHNVPRDNGLPKLGRDVVGQRRPPDSLENSDFHGEPVGRDKKAGKKRGCKLLTVCIVRTARGRATETFQFFAGGFHARRATRPARVGRKS